MNYKITGNVKKIGDLQKFTSRFQKRDIVLTTKEDYPQDIQIEFLNDNVRKLATLKEGHEIEVDFNLRGREWTSPQGEVKYFNSIVGWSITYRNGGRGFDDVEKAAEIVDRVFPPADEVKVVQDDLPF